MIIEYFKPFVGQHGETTIPYIEQAAAIMANLSEQEREAMETLNLACASLSS